MCNTLRHSRDKLLSVKLLDTFSNILKREGPLLLLLDRDVNQKNLVHFFKIIFNAHLKVIFPFKPISAGSSLLSQFSDGSSKSTAQLSLPVTTPPSHPYDTLYKAPSYSLTLQPPTNFVLSVVCPSEVRQGHCRRSSVHHTHTAGHFTHRFTWRQTTWCLPLFHITGSRDPLVLALCVAVISQFHSPHL
jgi:hypothetical protein